MQRSFNKLLKKQNKAAAQSETLKAHPTNTLLHIFSVICLQWALQFYGNFLSSLTEHLFPILPKPENKKLVPQAESWQSWKDHHLHRHQRGFHHAALRAENNHTPVTHPQVNNLPTPVSHRVSNTVGIRSNEPWFFWCQQKDQHLGHCPFAACGWKVALRPGRRLCSWGGQMFWDPGQKTRPKDKIKNEHNEDVPW